GNEIHRCLFLQSSSSIIPTTLTHGNEARAAARASLGLSGSEVGLRIPAEFLGACGLADYVSGEVGQGSSCRIPLKTTARVPDPDLTVAASCSQLRSARMPGNVVKHSTMAPKHESLLARARVPNPQRVVEACRRQALSIWTPGESGH